VTVWRLKQRTSYRKRSLRQVAGESVKWLLVREPIPGGAPVAVMFPAAVFLSLWASPHALVYEWALLVAAAVVVWERFPDRRDAWVCLFALAWVALAISTPLAKSQIAAGWPVAVQVAVPVLGVVGWLAAWELEWAAKAQARPPGAHASAPVQPDRSPTVDTPPT
jgi:hypothetical protein